MVITTAVGFEMPASVRKFAFLASQNMQGMPSCDKDERDQRVNQKCNSYTSLRINPTVDHGKERSLFIPCFVAVSTTV